MKKFTFLFFVLLLPVLLNAQEWNELKSKFQKMQKTAFEMVLQIKRTNEFLKEINTNAMKSAVVSQKLDSTVSKTLSAGGSSWQNDYKDEFLYDQNMRNTEWTERIWNLMTNAWEIEFKAELSFDNEGHIAALLMYDKDTLTNILYQTIKFSYFYNSAGLPDSVLTSYSEDDGASWNVGIKQSYFYNTSNSNQLTKTEFWMYDEDAGALVLGMKTDYTYTSSGKIQNSITSYIFAGWEFPGSKSEYTYDSSDRISAIVYYEMSYTTGDLELSSRDSYQYNANGDVSIQINSFWSGSAWNDDTKDEYEYSTTDFAEVAFPISVYLGLEGDRTEIPSYSKTIHLINSYEMTGGNWKQTDVTTFYYSTGSSTGTYESEITGFKCYPNPATESVTFNWSRNGTPLLLKLYQVTGAELFEQNCWSGKEIQINQLASGIYYFNLMNKNQIVYSGKIVKR